MYELNADPIPHNCSFPNCKKRPTTIISFSYWTYWIGTKYRPKVKILEYSCDEHISDIKQWCKAEVIT